MDGKKKVKQGERQTTVEILREREKEKVKWTEMAIGHNLNSAATVHQSMDWTWSTQSKALYFQWEPDNEFKAHLHLTSLPDALAPLQLKLHP